MTPIALENRRGRRECRVLSRTHSLMCELKKHMSVVTTGEAEHRHSLRNGFDGLWRARPGETGFCVTVTREIITRKLSTCL
jgi:hypothetical protein